MADNLSPLVNLDLINQIYKTINAQITERVYDPQYNPEATLGSKDNKYKSAWISGDTSTGTLNGLTLKKADAGAGFVVFGGNPSKTLTVADTATISKSLEVTAATSITGSLTVSAATNIVKSLNVGAAETYTGAVTIRSKGAKPTTITGPDNLEAILVDGAYTTSATTENSTTPEENKLLKIKKVDAKTFLAGPESGSKDVPNYRSIKATDLPEASASANGIVTTGNQEFKGTKTFKDTISGSINGNAATLSLSVAEESTNASRFIIFQSSGNNTSKLSACYDSDFKYDPKSNLMNVGSVQLNSAVTLKYNSSTESLDFVFA